MTAVAELLKVFELQQQPRGRGMSGHEHHEHDELPAEPADDSTTDEHHDHAAHDHGDHSHHDPAQFRRKFWLSLDPHHPDAGVLGRVSRTSSGLPGPRFPGSQFIPAAFGLAIFLLRRAACSSAARSPSCARGSPA